MLLVTSVLFLLALAQSCNACFDRSNYRTCEAWKRAGWCSLGQVYVYCKKTCDNCGGGVVTRPPITRPPVTRPPVTNPPRTRPPFTQRPPSGQCGISSVQQGRIVEGEDATKGAWPWVASLQKSGSHFCGATLLSTRWVLTASHCVGGMYSSRLGSWSIKLGSHDHRAPDSYVQTLPIKRVIKHPEYSRLTLKSDMAMIELARPAKLNSRVAIACLPNEGVYPSIGTNCYIAGWGSIRHPGRPHHTLQQSKLPVVESSRCKHQREVVCVGKGFGSQPNGRQQPNACRGDSGGPLVCQRRNGQWNLEGVASFVYEYCKYYTGYSPVNKYLSWIQRYLNQ